MYTEVTTVSLVAIQHPASLTKIFFLMMRTLKIYFLSNFPVCSIINYGHHAVHCICMPYLIYNWKFVSFDSFHLHSLPLPPPPLCQMWLQGRSGCRAQLAVVTWCSSCWRVSTFYASLPGLLTQHFLSPISRSSSRDLHSSLPAGLGLPPPGLHKPHQEPLPGA